MTGLSGRLLAGAAASLTMVSGAGAADLPMKAKAPAVQYVKVCSLYGAGFYYIPGTDTCLKVGGHLRVDAFYGPSGGDTESVRFNADYDLASQRYFYTRARAFATFDARTQTAYGTLRSYFQIGATYDGNGNGDAGPATGVYMRRAFIQLAGFTWGLTTSIFDGYSSEAHVNYTLVTHGSANSPGVWQWRYTAEFGNGFSASIAAEEPRLRIRPIFGSTHVGAEWPDILGQLQARGSWGRAQVAVAIKDASAVNPAVPTASVDEIGWAASVGGLLRVPGLPGDTFGFQFAYAKGATDYVTANSDTAATGIFALTKDSTLTRGYITDGVITGAGGSMELTTAWGFEVGYEHRWSPSLKTSLVGGYVSVEYDGAAEAVLCVVVTAGCADTSFWNIASRTQWNPVPNFSVALDVVYTHIDDANDGVAAPAGIVRGEADVWTGLIRVRRDYWP